MTQKFGDIVDWYHDIMENKSDPRVNDWPMMSSPFPTIFISIFYAIFVTKIGPNLMKNRKAFQFNNILIFYNALQVCISTWMFYEASMSGWLTFYSFKCQPVDYSNNPVAVRMANVCWWYYISKFGEFFDTLFFVLRKKNSHISTLHVIHHGIMPVSSWHVVKFIPGGQHSILVWVNSFVHIIMYTYYMLAAMGPKIQPYLWWKRHLTHLQLAQFVVVVIHTTQILFIDCDMPKDLAYLILAHGFMFLALFGNFYHQAYLNKETQKDQENEEISKESKINDKYSTTQDDLRKRLIS